MLGEPILKEYTVEELKDLRSTDEQTEFNKWKELFFNTLAMVFINSERTELIFPYLEQEDNTILDSWITEMDTKGYAIIKDSAKMNLTITWTL